MKVYLATISIREYSCFLEVFHNNDDAEYFINFHHKNIMPTANYPQDYKILERELNEDLSLDEPNTKLYIKLTGKISIVYPNQEIRMRCTRLLSTSKPDTAYKAMGSNIQIVTYLEMPKGEYFTFDGTKYTNFFNYLKPLILKMRENGLTYLEIAQSLQDLDNTKHKFVGNQNT